jgi:hypothetical protein
MKELSLIDAQFASGAGRWVIPESVQSSKSVYGSDGTGEVFGPNYQGYYEAFCEGLGDVSGAAVGRAIARLSPVAAAGLGELVKEGVNQCCLSASFDSCFGKPYEPPPDHSTGGGGATGNW